MTSHTQAAPSQAQRRAAGLSSAQTMMTWPRVKEAPEFLDLILVTEELQPNLTPLLVALAEELTSSGEQAGLPELPSAVAVVIARLIGQSLRRTAPALDLCELGGAGGWTGALSELNWIAINWAIWKKFEWPDESQRIWREAGREVRRRARQAASCALKRAMDSAGSPGESTPLPHLFPDLGRRAELELRRWAIEAKSQPEPLPEQDPPFDPQVVRRSLPGGVPRQAAALGLQVTQAPHEASEAGDRDAAGRPFDGDPRGVSVRLSLVDQHEGSGLRQSRRRAERARARLQLPEPPADAKEDLRQTILALQARAAKGPGAVEPDQWRRDWATMLGALNHASWTLKDPEVTAQLNTLCALMGELGVRRPWSEAADQRPDTPLNAARRQCWDDTLLLLSGRIDSLRGEAWT